MPARTRRGPSTATEVVESTEAVPETGPHRLKFNQPLSWRVGRPAIPLADLLGRLQTLAQELRRFEQEEVEQESFSKVAQELATAHLLAHKDRGVRAWTASCIVDVLRLCAPNAPFTGNQVKDIFTCIVSSILPALGDSSNPYNAQHAYVLHSLAEVKSIILLTDLDHSDTLIIPLFTTCFDVVSGSTKSSTGEEVAKKVEYDMTRLLVTIVDETLVLAPEVVDVIVAQFLRVDPRVTDLFHKKGKKIDAPVDHKQETLLLKEYPPAYNMAKAICQACPERMTGHISLYFNNVLIDSSNPSTSTSESRKHSHGKPNLDDSDEESEDIKELSKAHRLIRELWRACPEVLQNVIPQVEAELSAESVSLRLLGTQTIGDIAAGIGVAGPPPSPFMDPAAYPPAMLAESSQTITAPSVLLIPLSPKPFSQAHASAYESFLSRRMDKSATVRAAWVTVIGRILLTSAGGSGLSENEEHALTSHLTDMLRDADEKVRVAAVDAIGSFGFSHIVNKLASLGGFSEPESVFSILAERVKDRKHQVREHAMKTLARMWAVASGEIEQNNELVSSLLKAAPSKIFDAYYTNDMDIHALLDRVTFEILLPLNFPLLKSKSSTAVARNKDSQASSEGTNEADIDRIRVQRILTLLRGLDEKSRKVLFALQARQVRLRGVVNIYLQNCERYNGGVTSEDASGIKSQLGQVIEKLASIFPDSSRASADLWKFAKVHDRRNYQLVRFAMAATSDYRTVTRAIKELTRRVQSSNHSALLETFTPLLYRCSSLVFNRSHIPAIISLSRSDESGLANAAQEILKEISSLNPEVLEAQVQDMCKDLESQAPKPGQPGSPGAEELLKACAGFAKKLPSKLPKERKFLQALASYALESSSPRAAKHAVFILMVIADKREMYAKDLIHKCIKKWTYGAAGFLTKLAALSQLSLLATKETDEESETITSIAVDKILLVNRSPQSDAGYVWSDKIDDETSAKEWALKILINSLRAKASAQDEEELRASSAPVYNILNKLIAGEGELSEQKNTPAKQKPQLRLFAAKSMIKLCASHRVYEHLFSPRDFNAIALVAQDPLLAVRSGFVNCLKKNLVQKSSLSHRWYTIPCLLAFEPNPNLKDGTLTWLRSRAAFFSQQQTQANGNSNGSGSGSGSRGESQTVMESLASRLLSLLAHHPDYPSAEMDEATRSGDLADFARYILFYLSAVANDRNLSLIFHIVQRVKQVRDGISKSEEITTRLHTLSDLAQATIRRFADIYSQQHKSAGGAADSILETYPGKVGIPSSIFASMTSHKEAQQVAEKNFLPDEVDDLLDRIVRSVMRPKSASQGQAHARKRKPESGDNTNSGSGAVASASKKLKKDTSQNGGSGSRRSVSGSSKPLKKAKKKTQGGEWSSDNEGGVEDVPVAARRRSGRGAAKRSVNYADRSSDEDDDENVDLDDDNDDDEVSSEEQAEV